MRVSLINKNMPFKIAIVGLGQVSQFHLRALKSLNDSFLVVAACDKRKELAAKVGSELKVPFYTDLEELLTKHEDVELVFVLTSTGI